MILITLVANQPASAATWIYSGNMAIGLSLSGRHVSTVTVEEYPNPGIPSTLTLHYDGYGANGVPKGPQKSLTFTCFTIICAHTWTINFTYAAGDWVYGWGKWSPGANIPGVPTHSF